MKAALLCNGPSRVLYTPSDEYTFVMGCNVPWTDVDATTVVDGEMIKRWAERHEIIQVPTYFSKDAWELAQKIDDQFFKQWYAGLVKKEEYYHSSGHNAAEALISLGYTDIDIFGCDSYFKKGTSSSTDEFVLREKGPNWQLRAHDKMIGWKIRWQTIQQQNPNVTLNFIK